MVLIFLQWRGIMLWKKKWCVGLKVGNYIFYYLPLQLVGLPALQMPFTGVPIE